MIIDSTYIKSLGVNTACLNHALRNEGFAKAFDDATELNIQPTICYLPTITYTIYNFPRYKVLTKKTCVSICFQLLETPKRRFRRFRFRLQLWLEGV